MSFDEILKNNGLTKKESGDIAVETPIDGSLLSYIDCHSVQDTENMVGQAQDSFLEWRKVPAPVRGELVRLLGEELRNAKEDLGALVTLECGKILSEGLGEVQETIDTCDMACGLLRTIGYFL